MGLGKYIELNLLKDLESFNILMKDGVLNDPFDSFKKIWISQSTLGFYHIHNIDEFSYLVVQPWEKGEKNPNQLVEFTLLNYLKKIEFFQLLLEHLSDEERMNTRFKHKKINICFICSNEKIARKSILAIKQLDRKYHLKSTFSFQENYFFFQPATFNFDYVFTYFLTLRKITQKKQSD